MVTERRIPEQRTAGLGQWLAGRSDFARVFALVDGVCGVWPTEKGFFHGEGVGGSMFLWVHRPLFGVVCPFSSFVHKGLT